MKELYSVHPYMHPLGAAINIFSVFALSHIYPFLYLPNNASFDTFQSYFQTSALHALNVPNSFFFSFIEK